MDTKQLKRRLVIRFLVLMLLTFLAVILAKGTVASSQNPQTTVSQSSSDTAILWGDANGDDVVNIGDVTRLELDILYNWLILPGADANQDGAVDVGDITKVERLILGLDKQ